MSDRRQRFNAIQERVNELECKAKNSASLTTEEKQQVLDDLLRCGLGLADLALEQMRTSEPTASSVTGVQ